MKITSKEISEKTFEKNFRGYDKDEVTAFLNVLAGEWEKLMAEKADLEKKLESSEKEANALIAIAIVIIPGTSRVVRSTVLVAKANVYIEAAEAIGASGLRIMLRHVLPNVMAPILILVSAYLGNAILIEAALSFLGLSTQPPNPSWGLMLSGTGRRYMEIAPWLAIFPGLAISLTVLAFNMLGDVVRDVLDPRLRGS